MSFVLPFIRQKLSKLSPTITSLNWSFVRAPNTVWDGPLLFLMKCMYQIYSGKTCNSLTCVKQGGEYWIMQLWFPVSNNDTVLLYRKYTWAVWNQPIVSCFLDNRLFSMLMTCLFVFMICAGIDIFISNWVLICDLWSAVDEWCVYLRRL